MKKLMNVQNIKAVVMVSLAVTMLSSCAGMDTAGKKGQFGALGGAAGGALVGQAIGKNTESTLIGAAVGGMLGYMVGNEMDKYDLAQVNTTFETGVSNQPVKWVNPDTHTSYKMTPKPVYKAAGQSCRDAEVLAIIDGKEELVKMTACRDQHGQWQAK